MMLEFTLEPDGTSLPTNAFPDTVLDGGVRMVGCGLAVGVVDWESANAASVRVQVERVLSAFFNHGCRGC